MTTLPLTASPAPGHPVPGTATVTHGLPGPDGPTPAQLSALRTALEETRRERLTLLDSLTAEDLQQVESDTVTATQFSTARKVLQEAEAALRRMEEGTYGRCVHCDGAIPLPRLEFLPHVRGCVPCTQRADQRW